MVNEHRTLLHFLEGVVERRAQSMQCCIARLLERRSGCESGEEPSRESHHWEQITDGI